MEQGPKPRDESEELALEAAAAPGAQNSRAQSVLSMAYALGSRMWTDQAISNDLNSSDARVALGYTIAYSLDSVVKANELMGSFQKGSIFDCPARKAPSVSLSRYIERFATYTPATKEVFLSALIYIDRHSALTNVALTRNNVHRLFAASFVVASKFISDLYYSNKFYAKVAGLPLDELNNLERSFLADLTFSLTIFPELYNKYAKPSFFMSSLCRAHTVCPSDLICLIVRELRSRWSTMQQQQQQQQQVPQMQ